MKKFHLAEINLAQCKYPLDAPEMKEFVDFLAPVNALAEDAPGFVWRLIEESNTSVETPFGDQMIVVNMSVWEDLESLKTFMYDTVHSYFLKNRKKWFDKMEQPHVAMWWIPVGHVPTVQEAKKKLDLIAAKGSTADAFTFREFFDAEGKKL